MSVTFSGRKQNPSARHGFDWVRLYHEDGEERYFNVAEGNAQRILSLLGISCSEGPWGEMPIDVMIRKIQGARASFDYRVDALTRKPAEGRGRGGARFFVAGVDEDYFARRLEEFAEFVADLSLAGADTISWG